MTVSLPALKIVKFGDVVKNVTETCRDAEGEGLERYLGLEHLDGGELAIRRWGDLAADEVSFTRRFRKGQVLFGKRRAYLRKVALAEFDGVCSSDILTFESKDPKVLLPDLLPFFCQTDAFFDHALGTSAGSLSPRTRWSQLKTFEFTLPPLDEQKRLAELLWAAEQAKRAVETVDADLEHTRRIALFEMIRKGAGSDFRGMSKTSTNGRWNIVRVRQAGDVQLGRQRAPKYQTGGWTRPYLRVANVFDGYFDFSDVLSMDFDEADYKTYHLRPGDVLLNEGQSRELVGRCAMYEGQIEGCCFQNTLVRFRPGDGLLPEFAFAYFQYLFYRGTFAAIASQTTSIAHLGSDNFAKLYMPVPPIEDQKWVTGRLGALKSSKEQCASHLDHSRGVKASLLHAITRGTP